MRHRTLSRVGGLMVFLTSSASWASATPINWEVTMLVHGTVVTPAPPGSPPATPGTLVPVPVGTPLTIDLSFDSDTPNVCGPNVPFGNYLLGDGRSGSHVTLDFLGYSYDVGLVGVEVGTPLGSCLLGFPSTNSVYRFFLGSSGTQIDPDGILVQWSVDMFGSAIFFGPPASTLGGLPTVLPSDPFAFGGFFRPSSTINLIGEFSSVRTVPEPTTATLTILGTMVALARRRLRTRAIGKESR